MSAKFICISEYIYTTPMVVVRDSYDEAVSYARDESQKAIKRCTIYRMDEPYTTLIELRSYANGELVA